MVRPTNPSLVAVVNSVALLSFVVLLAIIGLIAADNWPKVLRVGLAFGGYAAVMLAGVFFRETGESVPYGLFAVAGAVAGVISGLVRPTIDWTVVLISALGGAFLLGTVHWAGCRQYEGILRR